MSTYGEFDYSFEISEDTTVVFDSLSISSAIDTSVNNGASLDSLFTIRKNGELQFLDCDLGSIGNMDNIISMSQGSLLLQLRKKETFFFFLSIFDGLLVFFLKTFFEMLYFLCFFSFAYWFFFFVCLFVCLF